MLMVEGAINEIMLAMKEYFSILAYIMEEELIQRAEIDFDKTSSDYAPKQFNTSCYLFCHVAMFY
jgi:hypothetical protein